MPKAYLRQSGGVEYGKNTKLFALARGVFGHLTRELRMKAQNRTGVWTPVWIEKLNLSHSQTKLLAEIVSLHEKEGCFASNKYLSEILGLKTDTVSRLISDLKKKGLLIQTGFDGRRRYLKPVYSVSKDRSASEKNPSLDETTKKKFQPTLDKKSKADSDFAAVPLITTEIHNKLHTNSLKRVDIQREGNWDDFKKWSKGRVTPTTWTIINQCTNPSFLEGTARRYWDSWASKPAKTFATT